MDNQIWAQVKETFEERRRQNEREEMRRRDEIAAKYPELEKLIEERHQLVLSSVRSAFAEKNARNAETLMMEYNQKIGDLLNKAGYPRDYLSPVFQCSVCRDQGFIYEKSVQKPCDCFLNEYLKLKASSGLDATEEQSFSHFDERRFPEIPLPGTDVTQREYMRIVKERCAQFAQGVPNGPIRTLLLHGGSGLGKTYLLHCIENDARARSIQTVYVTAYDLLMALKNAYFSRTGETAQEYFDVPLLLIDDLGMEPMIENVSVEQIYHLINARLTAGHHTAISTNLSREEIKNRYTERVSSRLLDTRQGMAIPFMGKDIRLIKP